MKVKNVPDVSLFAAVSYLRVFPSFSLDVLETSFASVSPFRICVISYRFSALKSAQPLLLSLCVQVRHILC
ncbi:hypothetical protein HBI56_202140 [Parastagonospora nodorum]|uniref:Uncharacterized protein n=1 Tax=Phaeosphaeria nodorum (strain SN15 / ATCC MYA-4574 / FGSC 10173) TaxID=321614 RepID=A0A7U2EVL8_PHANO|nr:hypothetical protein HBH56_216670 [Parastagonospora nodorum]QRC93956.1 hypothetical protein JI435_404830 [Parastagonospora nodorum SN15]KAH3922666.1 hypothetical protein HBH54_220860 [Parastagonospora nodorum]KAH3942190.1 hypothetical protein HBH53_190780 [Parastagonospora nodorum]KAH3961345.1 hypothetical protein HBH51_185340 [Parastagonospora nodorum]